MWHIVVPLRCIYLIIRFDKGPDDFYYVLISQTLKSEEGNNTHTENLETDSFYIISKMPNQIILKMSGQ